ncbi:MAG: hypothetical protein HY594_05155 [Candidatus Omnitrophica bacterium]|nr:hypothetical protein [Candidatus Omnitrophota bacterium]
MLELLADDISEALWQALTRHPQFEKLNGEAFLPLRGAVEEVLRRTAARWAWDNRAWSQGISDVIDRVNLIVEVMGSGRMPYGPMSVMAEGAFEAGWERYQARADLKIA